MKKLTLILFTMIALIGFNANAAMYIVGQPPFGNWNPAGGVEMTDNGNGMYTYTATINGTVNFVFADGLDSNWGTFNSQYRYGPSSGDTEISAGTWINTQKAGDHGAYRFSGTGDDYVFTFDLSDPTQARFKVEGYVAPVVYDSYTVAGEPAALFGNEWAPSDENNDMTLEDGLYTWKKENVALNAGTIKFKVVADHSWQVASWPVNNFEHNLEHGGNYDVTITFNPETKAVTCEATLRGEEVDDFYIVAGTENLFGSNWNAGDSTNLMTEGEAGIFTLTKEGFEAPAGTEVEFKVVANSNWSTCWPASDEEGDHNMHYTFENGGIYTVVITFDEETKEITINTTKTGDLPEPPQPETPDVYIMGDMEGYTWDAVSGVQMTYDETNKLYNAEINVVNADGKEVGYIGFTKMLADTTAEDVWAAIAPYRFGPVCDAEAENWVMLEELLGVECALATDDSYKSIAIPAGTWAVTVNLENNTFMINGEWPVDTVVPQPETPDVYIMGNMEGYTWDAVSGVQMTYDETNKVYTAEINVVNDEGKDVGYIGFTKMLADTTAEDVWAAIAPYRFGPVCDAEAENWVMLEELLGVECALATDGSYKSIAIPAGTWTVTVNLENNTFVIDGEWPEPPTPEPYTGDLYILGEVNGNGWNPANGVQMTYDAETALFTATVTAEALNYDEELDGNFSYFSFTKALAENENDWDAIADKRIGALSDGDFLVTDELLDQHLTIVNGQNAFKAPSGFTYNITVSVDEMYAIISKVVTPEFEIGDVNHDHNIDVSDVTLLIAYVLGNNPENFFYSEANVNDADGNIDVGDVTALIAKVLSN